VKKKLQKKSFKMSIQEQFEAAVKVIQNLPKNGELANLKTFHFKQKKTFLTIQQIILMLSNQFVASFRILFMK